eukprot:4836203-Alexandrium_andersonii.AAC.1
MASLSSTLRTGRVIRAAIADSRTQRAPCTRTLAQPRSPHLRGDFACLSRGPARTPAATPRRASPRRRSGRSGGSAGRARRGLRR